MDYVWITAVTCMTSAKTHLLISHWTHMKLCPFARMTL